MVKTSRVSYVTVDFQYEVSDLRARGRTFVRLRSCATCYLTRLPGTLSKRARYLEEDKDEDICLLAGG